MPRVTQSERVARQKEMLAHGFDHLLHRVVKDWPGKIPAMAAAIGKNERTLQNELNPTEPQELKLHDFLQILRVLQGDSRKLVLAALSIEIESAITDMRGLSAGGDLDLLDAVTNNVQQNSEFLQAFRDALSDGDVTQAELIRIEKEYNESVASGFAIFTLAKQYMRPGVEALEMKKKKNKKTGA